MEQWIELDGLILDASVGIHEHELRTKQPYAVSFRLLIVQHGGYFVANDSIAEALDYDELRRGAMKFISGRHFNLQETIIQGLIQIAFCLDDRVASVQIAVKKTSVYDDARSVGLFYSFSRSEWTTHYGNRVWPFVR